MDALTNPAFILFSAVSPMLIAVLKQSGLPRQANALIAFIAYIVVGVGGAIMSGQPMTTENIVAFVSVATVVGTAAYNIVWNNLGANTDTDASVEEQLTEATSVVKPSA